MALALAVALAAVSLGLGLGLLPGAGRRVLGPLRTLALAAVIGVGGLHLLPEALGGLGLVGVLVFALGLAVPRWIGRRKHEHAHGSLGLEVGFIGLLIHHLGDGLALGVYSRMDAEAGYAHGDVLIALVLHTVPLVAVVSAGYARIHGVKAAVRRSLALALASVVGILVTGLIPESLVERVEAWIAAGVAGLLLHGMSHDLTEDLPHKPVERVLDVCAATAGLLTGYIGARLDASSGHSRALVSALGTALLEGARAAALPLLLGLALGALWPRALGRVRRALIPEAWLLGLVLFGWSFLWVLPMLGAVYASSWRSFTAAERADAAESPLGVRFDRTTVWAFSGLSVASVLGSALPGPVFAPLGALGSLGAVALGAVALPIHAVLAPLLAATLVERGLWPAAGLVLCVLGPLLVEERALRTSITAVIVCFALALALLDGLVVRPLFVPSALSTLALVALGALTFARIYARGFRGWLSAVRTLESDQCSRTAKGSATTTGSPDASGASTPA